MVQGFIDIYGQWIDDFGIDGYRIDTARHVNPEFWRAFVPAMLARAKARGVPNFHIFGEVAETEPGILAKFTRVDGYPAVLDFAFQAAVADVVNGKAGPPSWPSCSRRTRCTRAARRRRCSCRPSWAITTLGRIGHFVRLAHPGASDDEAEHRRRLVAALPS